MGYMEDLRDLVGSRSLIIIKFLGVLSGQDLYYKRLGKRYERTPFALLSD